MSHYNTINVKSLIDDVLGLLNSLRQTIESLNINNDNKVYYINSIAVIRNRVKKSPTLLIDNEILGRIYDSLNTILHEIGYNLDENINYNNLVADNIPSLDKALEESSSLPFIINSYPKEIRDHINIFINKAIGELDFLRRKVSELTAEIQQQEEHIESLTPKINSGDERINSIYHELSIIEREQKVQLEASIINFNKELEKINESYQQQLTIKSNDYQSLVDENKENTDKMYTDLQSKITNSKIVLDKIGNIGITGNYNKVANEHKAEADKLRTYGLILMAIFFLILVIVIICSIVKSQELTMTQIITRFLGATLLSYPIIYLTRESSKHRALENKNRSLELQLSSLSPFLELLPEENKNKVKEELVSKYFTGIVEDHKEENINIMVEQVEKLSKAIAPLIHKEK